MYVCILCICVCVHVTPDACGDQRETWFSSSIMRQTDTFTCWVIILLTLKHFKRVLNYFFLYVCIGEIHMHSGTCRDKRSTSDVASKEASTLISETPSLTDSELTKYARLDYQRTPEVHQFHPPQLWERISTPMVGI